MIILSPFFGILDSRAQDATKLFPLDRANRNQRSEIYNAFHPRLPARKEGGFSAHIQFLAL